MRDCVLGCPVGVSVGILLIKLIDAERPILLWVEPSLGRGPELHQ